MKTVSFMMMSMALGAMFLDLATATDHVVGAPGGSWDYFTNLPKWAASNHFKVGDNLVFQYSEMHNVLEVSTKADYDACKVSKPLLKDESGNTIVKLKSAGKRYFICGVTGHCAHGMKMEIDTK